MKLVLKLLIFNSILICLLCSHRELQATVEMDDLQDMRNLNPRGEIQLVNVHEGLDGQHVHMQPGNNNIIHMADDRDRAIRDYAVLTP